jgi:hypothetical protein
MGNRFGMKNSGGQNLFLLMKAHYQKLRISGHITANDVDNNRNKDFNNNLEGKL